MTLHTATPNPQLARERLLSREAHALAFPELPAIILRTGVKGCKRQQKASPRLLNDAKKTQKLKKTAIIFIN